MSGGAALLKELAAAEAAITASDANARARELRGALAARRAALAPGERHDAHANTTGAAAAARRDKKGKGKGNNQQWEAALRAASHPPK